MKKLVFCLPVIFFIFFTACEIETPEEPIPIPEKWNLEISFQNENFFLITEVYQQWGEGYPTKIVGKRLLFENPEIFVAVWQKNNGIIHRLEGKRGTRSFGNINNPIEKNETTRVNFCGGPQNVPVSFKLTKIQ